jgi:methionyl-tRNA formyltransferase
MRIVMMGTGSFAEPTFAALLARSGEVVGLFTQPDRATGKERGSTRQAHRGMKDLAVERGIPVLQPESINTPEDVASLRALRPDLLVVAAYGQILSNDVLASAAHGGINIHASWLPKYRGAAPINWAIYHGETRTGVSIIRMSIALDAGDILAQEAVDIGSQETAGELEARLGPLGAKLAVTVVDRIATSEPLAGVKQDKSLVTKAPKLTKEHGLIDWRRTAKEVCNQVRAMQPWPTAYTFLHRQSQAPLRLIVMKAHAVRHEVARAGHAGGELQLIVMKADAALGPDGTPGTIYADAAHKRLVVAAADGVVEIVELQPAGKRRMAASEFLRGNVLPPGARMGPEAG